MVCSFSYQKKQLTLKLSVLLRFFFEFFFFVSLSLCVCVSFWFVRLAQICVRNINGKLISMSVFRVFEWCIYSIFIMLTIVQLMLLQWLVLNLNCSRWTLNTEINTFLTISLSLSLSFFCSCIWPYLLVCLYHFDCQIASFDTVCLSQDKTMSPIIGKRHCIASTYEKAKPNNNNNNKTQLSL